MKLVYTLPLILSLCSPAFAQSVATLTAAPCGTPEQLRDDAADAGFTALGTIMSGDKRAFRIYVSKEDEWMIHFVDEDALNGPLECHISGGEDFSIVFKELAPEEML